MKIIHIVENLDKGAVENWLVQVFLQSRSAQPEWKWTFYCILGERGKLDGMVKDAGGEILYSPVPLSRKLSFLRHLRKTLRTNKYDIIHSHHDYLSGFYLLAAIGLKFKRRILHIHNTDKALPIGNLYLHNLLLKPFRSSALIFSDLIVGISNETLIQFIGNKKVRSTVLYYGINVDRFKEIDNREWFRQALNVEIQSKILLFVGRMNRFKNPLFVIDILKCIMSRRADVYAVFVGEGEVKDHAASYARELDVESNVRFIGWSNDIPRLMKSADLFIFPRVEHPKEGLGLVVVEAQAAGLPMVLSKGIVPDAIVIEELAHFISLNNNPSEWAERVIEILNQPPKVTRENAYLKMKHSRFELNQATSNLLRLYA